MKSFQCRSMRLWEEDFNTDVYIASLGLWLMIGAILHTLTFRRALIISAPFRTPRGLPSGYWKGLLMRPAFLMYHLPTAIKRLSAALPL